MNIISSEKDISCPLCGREIHANDDYMIDNDFIFCLWCGTKEIEKTAMSAVKFFMSIAYKMIRKNKNLLNYIRGLGAGSSNT